MPNVTVSPPPDGLHTTITVPGPRTYSCAAGQTINVPDFDVGVLLANGWQIASGAGAASTPVTCALSGGGTSTQTASGTAPAGSTVTVTRNGTAVGTATASGTGAWSLALTGLANGDVVQATVPIASNVVAASVTATAVVLHSTYAAFGLLGASTA